MRCTVKLLPWGTTCCNSKLILSRAAFTGAGAGDVLAPKLIHLVHSSYSCNLLLDWCTTPHTDTFVYNSHWCKTHTGDRLVLLKDWCMFLSLLLANAMVIWLTFIIGKSFTISMKVTIH